MTMLNVLTTTDQPLACEVYADLARRFAPLGVVLRNDLGVCGVWVNLPQAWCPLDALNVVGETKRRVESERELERAASAPGGLLEREAAVMAVAGRDEDDED